MPMSEVARALEMDEPRGLMKAIVDAETEQILGCAVLGLEGGEVMAMVQIAMMGNAALHRPARRHLRPPDPGRVAQQPVLGRSSELEAGRHDAASPRQARIDPEIISPTAARGARPDAAAHGPLSDEELGLQHDPLMSPILWDLGHIAHFEELWLTHNLDGPIEFVEMPGLFNPFEHPRSERGALPLPDLGQCRAVMAEIRRRVLDRLSQADFDSGNPLLRDGYVYQMVLQHEYQHNETILQTLQLKQGAPYRRSRGSRSRPAPSTGGTREPMVRFPGGVVEIGTDDRSAAYDNERPRTRFSWRRSGSIVNPVTNGEFEQLHRGRRLRHPGLLVRGRLGTGCRNPAPRRRSTGAGTTAMGHPQHGPKRSGAISITRSATCATTRPRRMLALRASACPPNRVGGSGIVGPGDRHQADLPLGRGAADAGSSPTWISSSFGTAPVGALSAQRLADRLLWHDRRRLGVDLERL